MAMAEDESLPKSIGGSDLKSFLNELIQMKMDGASMDETQKQKCQAIDSIIEIIQHHSPTNHASSNERSGDPDILLDLKKHEGQRESQNWPSDESNDEPKHQTDLLEMIQRISTSREQEILKEVDGKLSSFLECTALRDESMEAKSNAVPTTDDAVAEDAFQPTGSIHQVSMEEDPNIKQTDRVKPRVSIDTTQPSCDLQSIINST